MNVLRLLRLIASDVQRIREAAERISPPAMLRTPGVIRPDSVYEDRGVDTV